MITLRGRIFSRYKSALSKQSFPMTILVSYCYFLVSKLDQIISNLDYFYMGSSVSSTYRIYLKFLHMRSDGNPLTVIIRSHALWGRFHSSLNSNAKLFLPLNMAVKYIYTYVFSYCSYVCQEASTKKIINQTNNML